MWECGNTQHATQVAQHSTPQRPGARLDARGIEFGQENSTIDLVVAEYRMRLAKESRPRRGVPLRPARMKESSEG